MKTRDYHNQQGKFVRETRIDFGSKRQQLRIETQAYKGHIETEASVGTVTEDGLGWVHAFGMGSVGDFRRSLIRTKARGTPKAITAQHEKAFVGLFDLQAEISARYADGRNRGES